MSARRRQRNAQRHGARCNGDASFLLRRLLHDQFSRRADLDSSPDDNQHELFTSVSHCHWNTCLHSVVNFEDEQQRRSSSSRLARAHERAGRGRARRASKRGTEDTPCPVVVRSWRSVLWGVTTSSMGRETPEPLPQAAIVCELQKPLVQDKYSVKAKAQQLMYGVMGYILYFDRGYIITWR